MIAFCNLSTAFANMITHVCLQLTLFFNVIFHSAVPSPKREGGGRAPKKTTVTAPISAAGAV